MPNIFTEGEFTVIRAHNPNWAWDPLSGEGARLNGGRFNWPGLPALYVSLDVETAIIEAQQSFVRKIQPMTLVHYDLVTDGLVDLTDNTVQEEFNFSSADLADAWLIKSMRNIRPEQWKIISNLLEIEGFSGVIAPSFAPGASGKNIILFDWSDDATKNARITPIDDDGRLPTKT